MREIKRKSYEKYQMHWMLTHDITIADLNREAGEWHTEQMENPSDGGLFSDYLENGGFGGCLWACYNEFLESEYQNRDYMRFLLTEEEWIQYLDDVGDGHVCYIDAWNLITECVNAGILQEMDSHICIVRETGWYLEPKDMVAKDLMYDKHGREVLKEALTSSRKEGNQDGT